MDMPDVYRPIPRRAFELTPASTESSVAPSPKIEPKDGDKPGNDNAEPPMLPPSRTRSILNLTSSTLLGIYADTATNDPRDDTSTPWGTGAQTPGQRNSVDANYHGNLRTDLLAAKLNSDAQKLRAAIRNRKKTFRNYYWPLVVQTSMLFLFGTVFGILVTHLHRRQQISPVPVPATARTSWYYQFAWGVLGVLIGNVLPRIDTMLEDEEDVMDNNVNFPKSPIDRTRPSPADLGMSDKNRRMLVNTGTLPLRYSTVRSMGAFIGIAFAVRRVPWQSTLQVSLTLAIANPVLWYLIDRSKSGFWLSTVVGMVGSFLLLLINPGFVPVPSIHQDQASEKFGVYTWLASILFCTSLCFGAIGRKLQL